MEPKGSGSHCSKTRKVIHQTAGEGSGAICLRQPPSWIAEMIGLLKEKNLFEARLTAQQTGGAFGWDYPAWVEKELGQDHTYSSSKLATRYGTEWSKMNGPRSCQRGAMRNRSA
jgi:hypothetical protein